MMLDENTPADLDQSSSGNIAKDAIPICADEEDDGALEALKAMGISREEAAILVRLVKAALW